MTLAINEVKINEYHQCNKHIQLLRLQPWYKSNFLSIVEYHKLTTKHGWKRVKPITLHLTVFKYILNSPLYIVTQLNKTYSIRLILFLLIVIVLVFEIVNCNTIANMSHSISYIRVCSLQNLEVNNKLLLLVTQINIVIIIYTHRLNPSNQTKSRESYLAYLYLNHGYNDDHYNWYKYYHILT